MEDASSIKGKLFKAVIWDGDGSKSSKVYSHPRRHVGTDRIHRKQRRCRQWVISRIQKPQLKQDVTTLR